MRALSGLLAVIAVVALTPAAAALARASSQPPTPKQIRTAVRRAEHSRDLWATVNVCHSPRFGIRGQMPALGFPSRMTMKIQVDYWNSARQRFTPLSGVRTTIRVGRFSRNVHQEGAVWRFTPPAVLSGKVTFEWRLGHRLIGRVTRLTAHGVKGVDFSDPKGRTTATCTL